MTFSAETKNSLCKVTSETWCCKRSELAALVCFAATRRNGVLKFNIENKNIADRIRDLVQEVTLTEKVGLQAPKKDGGWYTIRVDADGTKTLLRAVGLSDTLEPDTLHPDMDCCVASFLRGAFLGGGSVADPEKNYHMEFVTTNPKVADFQTELLATCGYIAGLTVRKNHFVVYIKDSEAIAELLGRIGAGMTMMDFYNIKIEREVRNRVNRQMNCDSANLTKTMNASQKQVAAIQKIERIIGLDALPPPLAEMAKARVDNPELSLQDLAATLNPPIGKSGANHRLAKLLEIAESL